jgi:hypothetical protein
LYIFFCYKGGFTWIVDICIDEQELSFCEKTKAAPYYLGEKEDMTLALTTTLLFINYFLLRRIEKLEGEVRFLHSYAVVDVPLPVSGNFMGKIYDEERK